MTRGRGRGRGARRGFARAVRRVERPLERKRDFGCKHDPGLKPRNHVVSPWISLVVELGGSVDQVFNPNLIMNVLRAQHGFFVKTKDSKGNDISINLPMDIRFLGFKLWALSSSRPIGLTVFDFRSKTFDIFQRLTGWPAYNQFARCGFWLPDFMKDLVFDDSDTTSKIMAIDHASTGSWLCYVYCMVRPINAESISQQIDRYDNLVCDFQRISL